MKLIALVTLVTKAGEIPPGGQLDVKDAAEAKLLIARGFAAVPAKTGQEAALPTAPVPAPAAPEAVSPPEGGNAEVQS